MMDKKKYEDANSNIHNITVEIARGGQGVVFSTTDATVALKLETDKNGNPIIDSSRNNRYLDKRLLPIPNGINVALPRIELKDASGYVMTLLDDMQTLRKAFDTTPRETYVNEWIRETFEPDTDAAKDFGDYISTGGLRRRLAAYMKYAAILAQINANGLVYCDIKPDNAMISTDINNTNIWLIDTDNMDFQKKTSKYGCFTPEYAAPESMNGSGNTFYTDVYEFTISLFIQLTYSHPFKGKKLNECDWDDFADNSDDKAYSGIYPWIGDHDDCSNEASSRIPYDIILTKNLLSLINRMFSQKGRIQPYTRPSIFEIAYALANENDGNIICDNCQMGYPIADNNVCPWCDYKSRLVIIESTYENENKLWKYTREWDKKKTEMSLAVPLRVIRGYETENINQIAFHITINEKSAILTGFSEEFEYFRMEHNSWKRFTGNFETNHTFLLRCQDKRKACYVILHCEVIDHETH